MQFFPKGWYKNIEGTDEIQVIYNRCQTTLPWAHALERGWDPQYLPEGLRQSGLCLVELIIKSVVATVTTIS